MRDPTLVRDRLRPVVAAIVGAAAQWIVPPLPAIVLIGIWPTLTNTAIMVVCGLTALFVLCESLAVWSVNSRSPVRGIASFRVRAQAGTPACSFDSSSAAETPLPAAMDRRYRRLSAVSGLSLLLLLLLGIAQRAWSGTTPPVLIFIGTALMLSGVVLRVSAIRSLGRFFGNRASVVEDQALRIEGIHRWIRHPSEAGLLLFACGACLALVSGMAALVALLLLAPSVWLRLRCEDDALCRAFGQRFVDYRRRIPALVPRARKSNRFNPTQSVPA